MASIESNFQEMSTAYVGMTSAEGMCEAVEVVDLQSADQAEKSESSIDQYTLAGGISGTGGSSVDPCFLSAFRFALLTTIRVAQAAAAGMGMQFFLEGESKKIPLVTSAVLGGMAVMELVGHVADRGMQYVGETSMSIPAEGKRPGFSQLWSRAWNDCGGPARWGNPLHLPQWAKAKEKGHLRPPERASQPSPKPHMEPWLLPRPLMDFNLDLPDLSPEAIRNAAMAAATVIVIGGMIFLAPVGI